LNDLLRRPMPESRALGIMEQVCHVLESLHSPFQREGREWRLVYQDLKPDNILVGDHDACALLDLGGCRLNIGGQVGAMGAFTPGYCAPECQSSDPLSPATDTYTVGSTLFHMLTAISPDKLLDSKAAIGGLQWVPFSRWDWPTLERLVSKGTFRFVQKCLAEKPADRPSNGQALTAEIRSLRRRDRTTA
jgi:serine/threonine-protein kinase